MTKTKMGFIGGGALLAAVGVFNYATTPNRCGMDGDGNVYTATPFGAPQKAGRGIWDINDGPDSSTCSSYALREVGVRFDPNMFGPKPGL